MAHHGRIAGKISQPIDLVSSVWIGNRGENMNPEFGTLCDIQCIGNCVLVALSTIWGNMEFRHMIAHITDGMIYPPGVGRQLSIALKERRVAGKYGWLVALFLPKTLDRQPPTAKNTQREHLGELTSIHRKPH